MSEHTTEHGKEQKKSGNLSKILYLLVAALVVFSIVNISILGSINTEMSDKISLRAEESRPANISIIKMYASGCDDCFDIDSTANSLKQYNVKVTDEKIVKSSSTEGRQLIEQYRIGRLPAMIVQGEISKSNVKDMLASGELKSGAIVYAAPKPVYLDIASGRIVGRINATLIKDASCGECVNVSSSLRQLKQYGVSVQSEATLDISDAQAKALVEKYKIRTIPAILLSPDITAYSGLGAVLEQTGSFESDGTYVLRTFGPPYKNLSTNEIIGRVAMINLVDATCEKCYNVSVNKQILQEGYGVYLSNETTYDINSAAGKGLLSKYNITSVPTFLLSPETGSYAGLMQTWNGIGTIEKDGWFVFRYIKAIQTAVYKDLSTNQTVGG